VANHPSAEKRHRQSLNRKTRNAARRSMVLTATRKLELAVESKDQASAGELLKQAVSQIMRARTKGIFKRNTAARKVARLHRLVDRKFKKA
jgi:small subunit ribosomal protein S20